MVDADLPGGICDSEALGVIDIRSEDRWEIGTLMAREQSTETTFGVGNSDFTFTEAIGEAVSE